MKRAWEQPPRRVEYVPYVRPAWQGAASYLLIYRLLKVHTNYGAAYLWYRRCAVHRGTGHRPVPPVQVQALRALPCRGTRCAPVPCVLWVLLSRSLSRSLSHHRLSKLALGEIIYL